MRDPLPESLDPSQLLSCGATLSGRMPLAWMPRLCELLQSCRGEVEAEFRFGRDEAGRNCVAGHVRTRLALECQRCLLPFWWDVNGEIALRLIPGELEREQSNWSVDTLIWSAGELSLLDLIEEELLLQLPGIARHPGERCPGGEAFAISTPDMPRHRPFEALKTLVTLE